MRIPLLCTRRVKARRLMLLMLILQNKDTWSNILVELMLLLSVNPRLHLISLLQLNTRNQLRIMSLPWISVFPGKWTILIRDYSMCLLIFPPPSSLYLLMDHLQTIKILAPSWDMRSLLQTNLLKRMTLQSIVILSIGAQPRASASLKAF